MVKAKVISNYFGLPPNYFQLWLDSCAFNPLVTWLFYTDIDERSYVVPDNVVFKQTSLPELKNRFERIVGYPIRYNVAWDFCALKGVLGAVFEDDLGDAEFWGWCDCDVMYGDLTPCIEATGAFDKVMPKGHLSFIRNDPKLNSFILRHPLCRKAIAADEPGLPCFDELAIPETILPEFGVRQNNEIPFINTACRPGHFVLDDVATLTKALDIRPDSSVPFVATWHDGKMVGHFAMPNGNVKRIEVAYFHFFRRNMQPEVERLQPRRYYLIIPNRVFEYDGHEFSHAEILKLDRFRIHWSYWRKRIRIRKIIEKVFAK